MTQPSEKQNPEIPVETLKAMEKFFMRTSFPRILAELKGGTKNEKATSCKASH